MSSRYQPIDPDRLVTELAAALDAAPVSGRALRVALDGPDCASPGQLARALVDPLRARGRPSTTLAADSFWRDASLRYEHGREDVDSYRTWLDAAALRREVLDRLGPGGDGRYLPSLRDPATNRASRARAEIAAPGTVLLVSGGLLLGLGLPFDVTVHMALSPPARARRTAAAQAWTLPAWERYDNDVRPAAIADITIRADDPAHPAVAGLLGQ